MSRNYAGILGVEMIESYLECHMLLASRATVTAYLPVLAERLAAERLDVLARARGSTFKTAPEVPFICTGELETLPAPPAEDHQADSARRACLE